MKTGIAVIDCPQCERDRLHVVVLIGSDIYLCCRECRSVTFADASPEAAQTPPPPDPTPLSRTPPRYQA